MQKNIYTKACYNSSKMAVRALRSYFATDFKKSAHRLLNKEEFCLWALV